MEQQSTPRPADPSVETSPSEETIAAERAEAEVVAGADRFPSPAEDRATEAEPPVTDEQRRHAEEMLELGARQKGEGSIP